LASAKRRVPSSQTFPISIDGATAHAWVDYSLKLPADKEPPTTPGALRVASAFMNRVTLAWTASRDNVAIKY
jgi:hypothetical protein